MSEAGEAEQALRIKPDYVNAQQNWQKANADRVAKKSGPAANLSNGAKKTVEAIGVIGAIRGGSQFHWP